jgi:hypothetical protein
MRRRDLAGLEKKYEQDNLTEDLVKELHDMVRPYILRRIKSEVLKLPPKVSESGSESGSCRVVSCRVVSCRVGAGRIVCGWSGLLCFSLLWGEEDPCNSVYFVRLSRVGREHKDTRKWSAARDPMRD